jgi:hypothetical protein
MLERQPSKQFLILELAGLLFRGLILALVPLVSDSGKENSIAPSKVQGEILDLHPPFLKEEYTLLVIDQGLFLINEYISLR